MTGLCAPGEHDPQPIAVATASAIAKPPSTYCTKCGLVFDGTARVAATVAPNGIASISLPMVFPTGTAA